MSEPVTIALISSVGIVLAALIGRVSVQLTRVRRDTTTTRDQVANTHTSNLRVELDERHAETRAWFRRLERSIGGIRDDARIDRRAIAALSERVAHIEELEITHPRPRKEPPS